MRAEKVAQALIAGLEKDSSEILVGWQSHLAVWCQGIAPWLMEHILLIASPSQHRRKPDIRMGDPGELPVS